MVMNQIGTFLNTDLDGTDIELDRRRLSFIDNLTPLTQRSSPCTVMSDPMTNANFLQNNTSVSSTSISTSNRLRQFESCRCSARNSNSRYRALVVVLGIAVVVLLAFIIVSRVLVGRGLLSQGYQDHCWSPECRQQAAHMVANMNLTTAPCDNFYRYACGGFLWRHPQISQQPVSMENIVASRNRQLLQRLLLTKGSHVSRVPVTYNQLRNFYQSCRTAKRKWQSGGQVLDLLRLINTEGGWLLSGDWQPQLWELTQRYVDLRYRHRLDLFFQIKTSYGGDNATNRSIHIDYPQLELGTSTVGSDYEQVLNSFQKRLENVLGMLHKDAARTIRQFDVTACNPNCISQIVNDIVDVESRLYAMRHDRLNRNWLSQNDWTHKTATITELERLVDRLNWRTVLSKIYGISVDDSTVVSIISRKYLRAVNNMLSQIQPQQLQHYMMWKLVQHFMPTLGVRYAQLVSTGSEPSTSAEADEDPCLERVISSMPQGAAAVFIDYFRDHVTAVHESLTESVRGTLKNRFSQWLPEGRIREQLTGYIDGIKIEFGVPDQVIDDPTLIDQLYKQVSFTNEDFFTNIQEADKFLAETEANSTYWNLTERTQTLRPDRVTPVVLALYNTTQMPYGGLHPPWAHAQLASVTAAGVGVSLLQGMTSLALSSDSQSGKSDLHPLQKRQAPQPKQAASSWRVPSVVNALHRYRRCVGNMMKVGLASDDTSPRSLSRTQLDRLMETHHAFQLGLDLFRRLPEIGDNIFRANQLPLIQHASVEQDYFLAYAQARCQNKDEKAARDGTLSMETIVNSFVYNSEEFRRVFSCESRQERQCTLD